MLNYKNPQLVIESAKAKEGKISWRSPSNIAIIKYWGKHGIQLPKNPSISFTLENAYSETILAYKPKASASHEISINFNFDGKLNETFKNKTVKFFESILDIFPFLNQLHFDITSKNSFPHSAGIASSASGMSALALCLCSLEHRFFGTLEDDAEFRKKASFVARLGSGSACRSIYPNLALWGENTDWKGSSDLFAIPVEDIHEIFKTYHDDILIVSKGEKSVSSRAGHGLMDENIYADNRYKQARNRLRNLKPILQQGDPVAFGKIAESEALVLHALMMSSNPPYILIKPNTLTIIDKIQEFRKEMKMPLYFSLDAGPNLHLLYPDEIKPQVQEFITSDLLAYCENGQWIKDNVGPGPLQLD
jgi:diphosphomevalonate decarboxylase